MPISFTCSCGKKLKVADNLAGKKVKCPGCQKATPVPSGDDDDVPEAPPPAKVAKPAAKPASPIKPAAAVKPGAKDKPTTPPAKAAPAAKAKPAAPAKPPATFDDEPDLDDMLADDEPPPAPRTPVKKKPAPPPVDDDDDLSSLEDDDFPAPPPAKKGKKPVVTDEDEDFGNNDDDDEMPVNPRSRKAAPPKKKGGKGLILILLLLLVLAGGGGAYWWFFMQEPPRVPPITKGPGLISKKENPEDKNEEKKVDNNEEKKIENPLDKKEEKKPEDKKPEEKKEEKKNEGVLSEIAGVPAGTAGLVAFKVGDWWGGASGLAIQELPAVKTMIAPYFDLLGISPADIERVQIAVFPPENVGKTNFHVAAFGVVNFAKPIDVDKLKPHLLKIAKEKMVEGEVCYESLTAKSTDPLLYFKGDQMLIAADPPLMAKYLKKDLKWSTTDFDAELKKVDNSHLVIAGKIPPGIITPEALKSIPFTALQDAKLITGLQGFDVIINDLNQFSIQVSLKFDAADKAKELLAMAESHVGLGKMVIDKFEKDPDLDKKPEKDLVPIAKETLDKMQLSAEDSTFIAQITLPANLGELIPVLAKFVPVGKGPSGKTPEPKGPETKTPPPPPTGEVKSSPRQDVAKNLMRVVLAFHEHNDRHRMFPSRSIGKGLSWRVALLPFLGHKELYDEFKLDEPWDSEDNLKLIAKIPAIYRQSHEDLKLEPGETNLQILTGPNTLWPDDKATPQLPRSFIDGSLHTILVAEAAKGVPWTKPEDIAVTADQRPMLGFVRGDGFYVGMGDGTVYFYEHKKLDEKVLRMLIDPADQGTLPAGWEGEPQGPPRNAPSPKTTEKVRQPEKSQEKQPETKKDEARLILPNMRVVERATISRRASTTTPA